jgi:hypothetical protein
MWVGWLVNAPVYCWLAAHASHHGRSRVCQLCLCKLLLRRLGVCGEGTKSAVQSSLLLCAIRKESLTCLGRVLFRAAGCSVIWPSPNPHIRRPRTCILAASRKGTKGRRLVVLCEREVYVRRPHDLHVMDAAGL